METCQIAGCGRGGRFVRTSFRFEAGEAGEAIPETLTETGRIALCEAHDAEFASAPHARVVYVDRKPAGWGDPYADE